MSFVLEAVIAGDELLRAAVREVPGGRVARLAQGFLLLPLTDEIVDVVTAGSPERVLGFWRLSGDVENVLARWSVAGPVAYVEAEYFGGVGEQRAAVWAAGALELGPLCVQEKEHFSSEGSPASQALRRLGARSGPGEDEFTAVGLGRHRSTDDWGSPGSG
ncbi:hypothetical protein [Streptomyces sp. NPDC050738]|uniref:hypothetical protein n=1 Tax=Streptomyces sp. NPDC050738 TaxID=3154744 RepID=UPI003429D5BD